jgi:hypothetical protein
MHPHRTAAEFVPCHVPNFTSKRAPQSSKEKKFSTFGFCPSSFFCDEYWWHETLMTMELAVNVRR